MHEGEHDDDDMTTRRISFGLDLPDEFYCSITMVSSYDAGHVTLLRLDPGSPPSFVWRDDDDSVCLCLQEVMTDPVIAADGFSYGEHKSAVSKNTRKSQLIKNKNRPDRNHTRTLSPKRSLMVIHLLKANRHPPARAHEHTYSHALLAWLLKSIEFLVSPHVLCPHSGRVSLKNTMPA